MENPNRKVIIIGGNDSLGAKALSELLSIHFKNGSVIMVDQNLDKSEWAKEFEIKVNKENLKDFPVLSDLILETPKPNTEILKDNNTRRILRINHKKNNL